MNKQYDYYVLLKEPGMKKYKKLKWGNSLYEVKRFFHVKLRKLINSGKIPKNMTDNKIICLDGTELVLATSDHDGILRGYDTYKINNSQEKTNIPIKIVFNEHDYIKNHKKKKRIKIIKKLKI